MLINQQNERESERAVKSRFSRRKRKRETTITSRVSRRKQIEGSEKKLDKGKKTTVSLQVVLTFPLQLISSYLI